MLYSYIHTICMLLKIQEPVISYDTSVFPSKEVKAMYIHNQNTIYLSSFEHPSFEILFSIAHELRHAWQFQNQPALYFETYQTFQDCKSLDEYNIQPAELDANAFGEFILDSFFHISPQYFSLSENTRKKIHERAKEISTTLMNS